MWDCKELDDRCGTAGSWIGMDGVGYVWDCRWLDDRCGTAGSWMIGVGLQGVG